MDIDQPFKTTPAHRRGFYIITVSLFVLLGAVYVGNAWSPSSYAVVLEATFQAEEIGLIAGTPKCIRSDEFAVLTPYTQAAVNNRFARYNQTSFYREDLRIHTALPVKDWGMLFRPTMWLYPFVNPAYAFSFHHYMIIALFLTGYIFLNLMIGVSHMNAVLLSLTIFFTGFTQYWWTSLGVNLALFPWVLLCLGLKTSFLSRIGLFYWVGTCWLLSSFYPPIIISLAFAGLLILWAFRPELLHWRSVVAFGAASLAAVGTACFYLKDFVAAMRKTIYPGESISMGGGVGLNLLVSHLLPTSQVHGHKSLIPLNICESGTIGAFYLLLVLCFLDYARWKEPWMKAAETRRAVVILGVGAVAMYSWMVVPIPDWVVAPLLWNRVSPRRMLFAAGFIVILIAFVLARSAGFRLTWARFSVFSAFCIVGWYHYKWDRSSLGVLASWQDVFVLVPLGIVLLLARFIPEQRVNALMLGMSVLVGILAFGTFNPLQSAWPIFNRPVTAVTRTLDYLAAADANGTVAVAFPPGSRPGGVLNGWGYRSATHILVTPQLDIWSEKFPDIPEQERNNIFNRYAHIILTSDDQPRLIAGDAVAVPVTAFGGDSHGPTVGVPAPPYCEPSGFRAVSDVTRIAGL